MSVSLEMEKWIKAVDTVNKNGLEEAKKDVSPAETVDKDLEKTDKKIMQMKLDKLNMLIRKKYYEKDENTSEEKMFQFQFEDKGDHYEFTIPLNILFGRRTQEFAAKYWEDFFDQADIQTSFDDNIRDAIKQTSGISLRMRLNKKLTKEVGGE